MKEGAVPPGDLPMARTGSTAADEVEPTVITTTAGTRPAATSLAIISASASGRIARTSSVGTLRI
jgi:hypothetical protein